jgi:hypothetical protein
MTSLDSISLGSIDLPEDLSRRGRLGQRDAPNFLLFWLNIVIIDRFTRRIVIVIIFLIFLIFFVFIVLILFFLLLFLLLL